MRNACVALARELERRHPKVVTAEWWKELRGPRVFIDFNQNLRDKTLAAAYAVRPRPEATVACPVTWDEIEELDPKQLTIATVPQRLRERGDPMAAMDDAPGACWMRCFHSTTSTCTLQPLRAAPEPGRVRL